MLDRYTTGPLTTWGPPLQEAGLSGQIDSSLPAGPLSTSSPPVAVIVAWRVGRYNDGEFSPCSQLGGCSAQKTASSRQAASIAQESATPPPHVAARLSFGGQGGGQPQGGTLYSP